MSKKTILFALAAGAAIALSGCADLPREEIERNIESAWRVELGTQIRLASKDMSDAMATKISKEHPIIVTTFYNVNNVGGSSPFGKTASERVSSELTRQGWNVIEIKMTNSIKVSPAGEFILSTDLDSIAKKHAAKAVIVGNYSRANSSAFVTMKAVSLANSTTIAASDFSTRIPVNTEVFFK